ncbi:MAG: site-specific DNA-methyltransferase [Bacteroidales bacterium]|jgi:adenine-specific DNA-methyltransferase|nr:site-specific DNA-methyltransferase [Bacteroidales bacterium]
MQNDHLDLQSPDLVNQNIEKLAQLFPNCVTESAEGKAIDFDLLRQELSHQVVEGNKERYRLEWPGKREAIVTANLPTTKTLRPVREDSVDFDNTENLYIEGDNLEVLKLLQESYLGKIKMIYIDPPYNTGKDFVYKDNFSKDAQAELIDSGQKDEYNQRLIANPETAGRYHSDWLSMMYPRLKLARNLLKEDGVIFISIDDNEVHNLRKVSDEVFGEGNFVSNIIWHKRYAASNDAKGIPSMHDHIVVYQKTNSFERNLLPRSAKQDDLYKYDSNDGKGRWRSDNLTVKTVSEAYLYEITNPRTGKSYSPTQGRCWLTNQNTMNRWIEEGRVFFGQKGDGAPQLKRYLKEVQQGVVPTSYWSYDEVGHTDSSRKELKRLFISSAPFDNPKPTGLIKRILQISMKNDGVVLDFFGGSSTSADAILQLNSEDKGTRKFILVQIPESTDEKSEAYKAGYKNICEIGKERIRRAAHKIKEELQAKQQQKQGKLDFEEDTKVDISKLDFGFRVYRLDSSNMQDVYYRPQDYKQENLELFADNVKPDRSPDDLLAQVMLDWGLPLSLKIEQATINGKRLFKVAQNSLYACFDEGIDEAFAKAIAAEHPLRIVFRDSGFSNDTAKTNVKQLLKQLSPGTEMKVI